MAVDRRHDARSPIHSLAPVPVVFSGKVRGTGWLYDISRRGCKVGTPITPSLGESVALRLSLDQKGTPVVVEEKEWISFSSACKSGIIVSFRLLQKLVRWGAR